MTRHRPESFCYLLLEAFLQRQRPADAASVASLGRIWQSLSKLVPRVQGRQQVQPAPKTSLKHHSQAV
jgi:hypothetical protein